MRNSLGISLLLVIVLALAYMVFGSNAQPVVSVGTATAWLALAVFGPLFLMMAFRKRTRRTRRKRIVKMHSVKKPNYQERQR